MPGLSGFMERRRDRRRRRELFRQVVAEHAEAVAGIVEAADYRSCASFYEANEDRRGDDVVLGEPQDPEINYSVCWIPRTGEVVAFARDWIDEMFHRHVVGTGGADSANAYATLGVSPVPELAFLLGRTDSAALARDRVASATDLDTLRALLA